MMRVVKNCKKRCRNYENCGKLLKTIEKLRKLLKTIENCERGVAAHRYNTQLYNIS